jgi:hypothetical protein
MEMGKRIDTIEAERFLTELGRPTKAATLNTLRAIGGGPPFYEGTGKAIRYDTDDLEEWANSSL